MTMSKSRAAVFALAVLALLMLALSGPGTRMGWWDWRTGLTLYRWAAYVGIAAAVLALVLVALLAVPRWRVRPWTPVLALIIALVAIAPPLVFMSRAKSVPPIHDISTDLAEPPPFVALAEPRAKAPNGAAYEGAAATAGQQRAYGDIQPKILAVPPRDAVQRVIDASRALGWEVVSSDATTGRVEATATTKWFGFQDDVVVRVRPEGTGSRVDVRSASRVGRSDVGANAARVREFLAKLT